MSAVGDDQLKALDSLRDDVSKASQLLGEMASLLKFDYRSIEADVSVYLMDEAGEPVFIRTRAGDEPPPTRRINKLLANKVRTFLTEEALNALIPERIAEIKAELSELNGKLYAAISELADIPSATGHRLVETSELLDDAWRIIANAGEGNWSNESAEWQTAAHTFRKRYHEMIGPSKRPVTKPGDLPDVSPSVIYVDGNEVVDVDC